MDCAQAQNSDTNRYSPARASRVSSPGLSMPFGSMGTAYPQKGFYYLGGLTEATETLAVFTLMCLAPAWFAPLALGFAALCALTTVTRVAAGVRVLGGGEPPG